MRTLSELNIPPGIRVDLEVEGHRIRFPNSSGNHGRIGVFAGALWWAVLLLVGVPWALMSGAMDFWLTVLLVFFGLGATFPGIAWFLGEVLARTTLETGTVGPNALEMQTRTGVARRWNVHDLVDCWSSQDLFSAIVAVERRDGTVEAMRVERASTARWMVEVMQEWRSERASEPTEEADQMARALSAGRQREGA